MARRRIAPPSARAELSEREPAELVARGDLQLGEDLAQVVLHGPGADEQLGADLGVGEAVSCQTGDLAFLRSERLARIHGALACDRPGGQELTVSALGERLGSGTAEHLVRGPEILPGVDASVLSTQPLAIHQVCAGDVNGDASAREPFDRLAITGLGRLAIAQQGG